MTDVTYNNVCGGDSFNGDNCNLTAMDSLSPQNGQLNCFNVTTALKFSIGNTTDNITIVMNISKCFRTITA